MNSQRKAGKLIKATNAALVASMTLGTVAGAAMPMYSFAQENDTNAQVQQGELDAVKQKQEAVAEIIIDNKVLSEESLKDVVEATDNINNEIKETQQDLDKADKIESEKEAEINNTINGADENQTQIGNAKTDAAAAESATGEAAKDAQQAAQEANATNSTTDAVDAAEKAKDASEKADEEAAKAAAAAKTALDNYNALLEKYNKAMEIKAAADKAVDEANASAAANAAELEAAAKKASEEAAALKAELDKESVAAGINAFGKTISYAEALKNYQDAVNWYLSAYGKEAVLEGALNGTYQAIKEAKEALNWCLSAQSFWQNDLNTNIDKINALTAAEKKAREAMEAAKKALDEAEDGTDGKKAAQAAYDAAKAASDQLAKDLEEATNAKVAALTNSDALDEFMESASDYDKKLYVLEQALAAEGADKEAITVEIYKLVIGNQLDGTVSYNEETGVYTLVDEAGNEKYYMTQTTTDESGNDVVGIYEVAAKYSYDGETAETTENTTEGLTAEEVAQYEGDSSVRVTAVNEYNYKYSHVENVKTADAYDETVSHTETASGLDRAKYDGKIVTAKVKIWHGGIFGRYEEEVVTGKLDYDTSLIEDLDWFDSCTINGHKVVGDISYTWSENIHHDAVYEDQTVVDIISEEKYFALTADEKANCTQNEIVNTTYKVTQLDKIYAQDENGNLVYGTDVDGDGIVDYDFTSGLEYDEELYATLGDDKSIRIQLAEAIKNYDNTNSRHQTALKETEEDQKKLEDATANYNAAKETYDALLEEYNNTYGKPVWIQTGFFPWQGQIGTEFQKEQKELIEKIQTAYGQVQTFAGYVSYWQNEVSNRENYAKYLEGQVQKAEKEVIMSSIYCGEKFVVLGNKAYDLGEAIEKYNASVAKAKYADTLNNAVKDAYEAAKEAKAKVDAIEKSDVAGEELAKLKAELEDALKTYEEIAELAKNAASEAAAAQESYDEAYNRVVTLMNRDMARIAKENNKSTTIEDQEVPLAGSEQISSATVKEAGSRMGDNFYDKSGRKITDSIVNYDGKKYIVDKDGNVIKNKFVMTGDGKLLFTGNDGAVVTGSFIVVGQTGVYIYEDADIESKIAFWNADGSVVDTIELMHADENGYLESNKVITVGTHQYTIDEDGYVVSMQ